MKVFVAQLYIEPGVYFPYSHRMQSWLSNELTALAKPGPAFLKSYGKLFELMIRLSAKTDIRETEIVGPTVFKKDKDVEYSLFPPVRSDSCRRRRGRGWRRKSCSMEWPRCSSEPAWKPPIFPSVVKV